MDMAVVMGMADMVAQSVYLAVLGDAAASDLRAFRIPNRDPLLLAGAFAVHAASSGLAGAAVLAHLAVGLAVFAVGAVLFAARVWGGGDAKLLAAIALWTGASGLLELLMVMGLAGGILAVAVLALQRLPLANPAWAKVWRDRVVASGHVPYGVAIAAAAIGWWWGAMRPGWPV